MTTSAKTSVRYRFARRRWHVLFRLIDAVGGFVARLATAVRRSSPARPSADVRRVLLVQFDHLGDAVMTTALLPGLRRHYRGAEIDVLASPWNAEVFASRREVNRLLVSRWNRFQRGYTWLWPASLVYWAWVLRRRRYDVAIDVRGEFTIALLTALAGVPRRVGWTCAGGGFLLTDAVPFEPGRHEVESRRAILATLGANPRPIAPSFSPSDTADRFVAHMLGDFRRGNRPLVVFHIGAGTPAKSWPVEHWRELIGRAVVEFDANVVLVGDQSEVGLSRAITEDRYWPNVMDWTGRLTIDQLAALLRRAAVIVGADSGPAHLAAAVGANVVVIFSGTNDPRQWRPWGDKVRVLQHAVRCGPCYRHRCPLAGHPCLRDLTPAVVAEVLQTFVDVPVVLPLARFAATGAGRREEQA